jgi:GT2 family glycosyltransferase
LGIAVFDSWSQAIIRTDKPRVSLIIPAYNSGQTIGGCLAALREQSLAGFETIVVDSSPLPEVERIVTSDFPEVRFRRSDRRLLPYNARNLGVRIARADLLVFTDPDVYPSKEWMQTLVSEYEATGDVIVGSVECHGRKWIDLGTQICKFDKWLPGGDPRPIDIAPTVNMLCTREVFEQVGQFREDRMVSDTLFSWKAIERGFSLRFVPNAVVFHHHLSDLSDLVRERYARGREFANMRARYYKWPRTKAAIQLMISMLPIRLLRILARGARNALQAGHGADYVRTFPIVIAGQSAWLAGESAAYIASLGGSSSSEPA